MAGDPLYEALGTDRPVTQRRSGGITARTIVGVVVVIGVVGLAAGVWRRGHQSAGGDAVAIARIETAPKAEPAAAPTPAAPAGPASGAGPMMVQVNQGSPNFTVQPNGDTVEIQNGVKIIRLGASATSKAIAVPVPDASSAPLRPAPDPGLVEHSRFGDLPRIGPTGSRPSDVYARPSGPVQPGLAGAPRIALLVAGLGSDKAETAVAAKRLPAAVSFGFVPFGADLPAEVAQVRAAGHEVILQLPAESPGSDAGSQPHALSAAASDADNLDRLHWQMGRFTGYAGTSAGWSGSFMAGATAARSVLGDVAARGLFVLDDGTSSGGGVRDLAGIVGLPGGRADVVLDTATGRDGLAVAWAQLEERARQDGSAIGFVRLKGNTEALAALTGRLNAAGIRLVPVSALANRVPGAGSASTSR